MNERYQGNRQMFIHPQERSSPRQQGNLQPHSMQHQNPKKETHRVRLTVRGDKLNYNGPVPTPTADLPMAKLHWKSVLSTPDENTLL